LGIAPDTYSARRPDRTGGEHGLIDGRDVPAARCMPPFMTRLIIRRTNWTYNRVAQKLIQLPAQGERPSHIRVARLAIGTFTNSLIFLAW
jgi:hypothetical protein